MKTVSRDTNTRFDKFVMPEPNSGCWMWIGATRSNGYGSFTIWPKAVSAHRFSYSRYKGKIPNGMQVLHKCDNRICVRPDHLFLGTHMDNMRDMVEKGRSAKRESQGLHKLSEDQVAEIRSLVGKHRDIAKMFGVSQVTISAIKRNKTWKQS